MKFQFGSYAEREEFFSFLEKWCVKKGGLNDDFELLTRISKGGFGTVYKARRKVQTVKGMEYKLGDEIAYRGSGNGSKYLRALEYDKNSEI